MYHVIRSSVCINWVLCKLGSLMYQVGNVTISTICFLRRRPFWGCPRSLAYWTRRIWVHGLYRLNVVMNGTYTSKNCGKLFKTLKTRMVLTSFCWERHNVDRSLMSYWHWLWDGHNRNLFMQNCAGNLLSKTVWLFLPVIYNAICDVIYPVKALQQVTFILDVTIILRGFLSTTLHR